MTLKQNSNRGFTIVELLIVVVIIAILAAITIVAYNGIQARAKSSAAASAEEQVAKKAEIANGVASAYPTTIAAGAGFQAQTDSDLTGSGITFVGATGAGNLTAAPSSPSTVVYNYCTTSGVNAYQVIYWDYANTKAVTYTGGASGCGAWSDITTTNKTW